jgi:hypothetical protein
MVVVQRQTTPWCLSSSKNFCRPKSSTVAHCLSVYSMTRHYLLCVDVSCFGLNLGAHEGVGLDDTDGFGDLVEWLLII